MLTLVGRAGWNLNTAACTLPPYMQLLLSCCTASKLSTCATRPVPVLHYCPEIRISAYLRWWVGPEASSRLLALCFVTRGCLLLFLGFLFFLPAVEWDEWNHHSRKLASKDSRGITAAAGLLHLKVFITHSYLSRSRICAMCIHDPSIRAFRLLYKRDRPMPNAS